VSARELLALYRLLALLPPAVLVLASPLVARDNNHYTLSFDGPCGEVVLGPPGSVYDDGTGGADYFFSTKAWFADTDGDGLYDVAEVPNDRPGHTWDVILTSVPRGEPAGACKWSFGIGFEGPLLITDITTSGTVSCLSWRGPECLQHGAKGVELTAITGPPDGIGPQTEENRGALCFVWTAWDCIISIPRGTSRPVVKIRVFGQFPEEEGQAVRAKLFFGTRIGVSSTPGGGDAPFPVEIADRYGWVGTDFGNPPITTQECEFWLKATSISPFLRCDPNNDGQVLISDAVWIFTELFRGGVRTRCPAAADCNGDGARDISDGIYALSFLFTGGPPPPAPFPACGRRDLPLEECPPGSTRCPP
jgi:hypothetical protein